MTFVAELWKLAVHCNFGDTLGTTLRDRFVCGLNKENMQCLLLAEQQLTFNGAIKIVVATETAGHDVVELQGQCSTWSTEPVNKVQHKRQNGNKQNHFNKLRQKQSTGNKKPCFWYDGIHNPDKCSFIFTDCCYCLTTGHIEKACLKKKKEKTNVNERHLDTEPLFNINRMWEWCGILELL